MLLEWLWRYEGKICEKIQSSIDCPLVGLISARVITSSSGYLLIGTSRIYLIQMQAQSETQRSCWTRSRYPHICFDAFRQSLTVFWILLFCIQLSPIISGSLHRKSWIRKLAWLRELFHLLKQICSGTLNLFPPCLRIFQRIFSKLRNISSLLNSSLGRSSWRKMFCHLKLGTVC